MALAVPVCYDCGGSLQRQPEKLYHGFILGLQVHLEDRYEVRSNEESGFGRADLLISPRQAGQPGVMMELKVLDLDEPVVHALRSALEQIETRRYVARLKTAGAAPIHRYGVVFDGKRAYVSTPERMSPAAVREQSAGGSVGVGETVAVPCVAIDDRPGA